MLLRKIYTNINIEKISKHYIQIEASSTSRWNSNSSAVQPFARPAAAAPTSIADDNHNLLLNCSAASAFAARPCHSNPNPSIAAPRPRQQQPFFDEHFETSAGAAAADDDDENHDPLSRLLVTHARTSSDSAAASVPSRNSFGEPIRTAQAAAAAAALNTRSVVPVNNPTTTTSEMTEEELDNLVSDIDPTLFFDEPSTHSHAEHTSVPPQTTSFRGTRQPEPDLTLAEAAAAPEPEFDAASECSRPSGASSSYSRSTASSGLGSSTLRGSTASSKFTSAAAGAGARPQAAAVGIVRPMPSAASNAAASGVWVVGFGRCPGATTASRIRVPERSASTGPRCNRLVRPMVLSSVPPRRLRLRIRTRHDAGSARSRRLGAPVLLMLDFCEAECLITDDAYIYYYTIYLFPLISFCINLYHPCLINMPALTSTRFLYDIQIHIELQ